MSRIPLALLAIAPLLGGVASAQSFSMPSSPSTFSIGGGIPSSSNVDVPSTGQVGTDQRPSPSPPVTQGNTPNLAAPDLGVPGTRPTDLTQEPGKVQKPEAEQNPEAGMGQSGAALGIEDSGTATPAMPAQSTPLNENEAGRYDMQATHGTMMPNAQPGLSR